jgi:hypothetical protein
MTGYNASEFRLPVLKILFEDACWSLSPKVAKKANHNVEKGSQN